MSSLHEYILEHVDSLVVVADATGTIIYVSPSSNRILGLDPKELIGEGWWERTFTDREARRTERARSAALARGDLPLGRRPYLRQLVKQDGAPVWILWRDARTPDGRLIGIGQDYTALQEARELLEERNRYIETLLENLPIGVAVNTMDDGKSRYINRRFSEIYGWPPEDLVDVATFFENVYPEPDHRRRISERILADIASGDPARMRWEDVRITTRGGEERYVVAANIPLPDRNLMISTVQDVTARMSAERALGMQEKEFRALVEGIPDGIFEADPDGNLTYANPALVATHGVRSADDLVGRSIFSFMDPAESAAVRARFEKVLQAGPKQVDLIETRLSRADGSYFRADIRPRRIVIDEKVAGMRGIVRDLTSIRQAEEQRVRTDAVIAHVGEAIIFTDPSGVILYTNPAFERISGYSRQEALGKTPSILKSGQHPLSFYEDFWGRITSGQIWKGRFINRKKDGTLFTVQTTVSPVEDDEGVLLGYVAVSRDITEQGKLEDQLRQSQKMEAIGRLAGGIAHDFNNVLTVVLGNSEIGMAETKDDSRMHHRFEAIRLAGEHAAQLTSRLLAFGRRQVTHPELVDVDEVIKGLLPVLKQMIGERIEMGAELAASGRVFMDPGQLEQVVINLVVNAKEAMEERGNVTIETGAVTIGQQPEDAGFGLRTGPHIVLTVTDDGPGMTQEVAARAFEPFFTTKESGTGLGLSIVHGIAEQNNGIVRIYSEQGKGCVFRVYLPVTERLPVSPDAGPLGDILTGEGQVVLLVEDEEMVRELAASILTDLDFQVMACSSAAEAIQYVEDEGVRLDLLLTDVVMPGEDGTELARKVGALRPGIGIVLMSGYNADRLAIEALMQEGATFLSKPFTVQALSRVVREALARD